MANPQELVTVLEEEEKNVETGVTRNEPEDSEGCSDKEEEQEEDEEEEDEDDEEEEEQEEEEEEEERKNFYMEADNISDDFMDYVSKYKDEKASEKLAAREKEQLAKKERFRRLIGMGKKMEDEISIETAITMEDESLASETESSDSSTHPCLRDIDISDSRLKLLNFFNLYPVPKDPGVVSAFWILYPPPPAYKEDGIQKFIDLTKTLGLRPVSCVKEMLRTQGINLRYYGLDSRVVKAICEATWSNTSVQIIDFKDNWLTRDACYDLNDVLLENSILSSLNLSGCRIGPLGAKRLLRGLTSAPSLVELDLSRCILGDEGLDYIATAIYNGSNLQSINLADNNLGSDSAESLQAMLAQTDSLTNLDLSWNSLFTKEASKGLFVGLLKNRTLATVNLAWNALGKDCLSFLCLFLARSQNVTHLDLSGNRFTDKEGVPISKALAKNVGLEKLLVGNNPLRAEGALALVQAVTPEQAPESRMVYLDLENVWANKDVLQELKKIENGRPLLVVKLGGILSNYEIIGPDPRKIYFKRANYEAMKPKKQKLQRNFGHFVLTLEDKLITREQFKELIKRFKLKLSESLVQEIMNAFIGPKKYVDQGALKAFYLKEYPDTTLPPPPPGKKKSKAKDDGKGNTERSDEFKSEEIAKGDSEKDKSKRRKVVKIAGIDDEEREIEENVESKYED